MICKNSQAAVLLVVAPFLCAPRAVDLDTPKFEDFSAAEISETIDDSVDVRQRLSEMLSQNSVRHKIEQRSPQLIVITAYVEEPRNGNRVRKTAFRFIIGPRERCRSISVTWLIKSRGIKEESWSIQPEDEVIQPQGLAPIKKLFQSFRC